MKREIKTDSGDCFILIGAADSMSQAREYRQALEDHGVDCLVGLDELEDIADVEEFASELPDGVPIFVADEFQDEAEGVIAQFDDFDSFEVIEDDEVVEQDKDDEVLTSELDSTGSFQDENEQQSEASQLATAFESEGDSQVEYIDELDLRSDFENLDRELGLEDDSEF